MTTPLQPVRSDTPPGRDECDGGREHDPHEEIRKLSLTRPVIESHDPARTLCQLGLIPGDAKHPRERKGSFGQDFNPFM